MTEWAQEKAKAHWEVGKAVDQVRQEMPKFGRTDLSAIVPDVAVALELPRGKSALPSLVCGEACLSSAVSLLLLM